MPWHIIGMDLKPVALNLPGLNTYVQDIEDYDGVKKILDENQIKIIGRLLFSTISLIIFDEALTAEISKKGRLRFSDIILASVVFPHPGGPQSIKLGSESLSLFSKSFVIMPVLPTMWSCPTKSDNFLGLKISASGCIG
jgi:hypothetical protein